ncbi:hypothetical protein N7G274_009009 [Stereocaulon virgatum]|uniref:Aminoglycoside phosphotransferase domain-containing protein n=1 Tax=Stereocaulon virgatum TaxID=373712 RepID=A0ABR3ZXL6_9LECA
MCAEPALTAQIAIDSLRPRDISTYPSKNLNASQCYLVMIKYILPTDQSIQSSCPWHDDLHVENIFVNSESLTKVTGIVDWRWVGLGPLFKHACQPYLLDYNIPPTVGLDRPALSKNIAQRDPAVQKESNSLYLKQSLCVFYKTL